MNKDKQYLGDGVYVQIRPLDNALILTTENGVCVTNTIYLEYKEEEALLKFLLNRKEQHNG